jgi:hypothetical protein
LEGGIKIKWDYIQRTVDLSMPGYIKATLHKYQHPNPNGPNMHHIHGINPHMELNNNSQHQQTPQHSSLLWTSNAYKNK